MRLLILTQKVDRLDSNLGSFHRWIEEFSKYCQTVTVICLQEGTHDLPANVIVRSLGKEKGTTKLGQLLRLKWFVLTARYDAVFVHMNPEYIVLLGWWWRLLGKRIGLWYTHKQVDLKLRIAEKFANVILTASKESFRLPSRKVMITGHGIDTDFFSPVEDKKPGFPGKPGFGSGRIITAGRVSRSKHIESMIDMAAPEELVVAGAPITNDDKDYAKSLEGKANFVGPIPYVQMPDFYRSGKLFLNASTTGSIDRAVLEASACGIPVKTTNEAFRNLPQNNQREWVVENHSLVRLIPKIVSALQN